jgi:hypothetical protein
MQFDDRRINGPDLSFYQGNPNNSLFVDFQKMKDAGVWFAIFKVGQDFWLDPAFAYNWSHAKVNKIPRAAYWFLDKDSGGVVQAERFWNAIKDDPGEGPLVVDYEDGSGDWDSLYNFLRRLQELSKYPADRIWIYTGYYYWKDHRPDPIRQTASLMWFAQFPLWLAAYTDKPDGVLVPAPWVTAALWQRGTTVVWGPDYGVHSLELDWNTLNGGEDVFRKYFITDEVPTPAPTPTPTPPEEGGIMKYRVTWSYGVARRTAPHTGTATENTYTGKLYTNGMEVEVIEENIPDDVDPVNLNKTWVRFADGLYGASEYPNSAGIPSTRMVKVEEPAPEPEPTDPVIAHKIDIYTDGKIAVDNGDPF